MSSIPPECYPEKAPQVDDLLDTLSHHIRREIIQYFETHAEADTASREELVEHLLARTPETTRTDVEIQLTHKHLPKLAERGWIEYDPRSKQIRYHSHSTAPLLLGELHALFTA